jgi:hypothetical protein
MPDSSQNDTEKKDPPLIIDLTNPSTQATISSGSQARERRGKGADGEKKDDTKEDDTKDK